MWEHVIENLLSKLEFLARKQGITLEVARHEEAVRPEEVVREDAIPVLEESRTIA